MDLDIVHSEKANLMIAGKAYSLASVVMVTVILASMLTNPIRVGYSDEWNARSKPPRDLNRSG